MTATTFDEARRVAAEALQGRGLIPNLYGGEYEDYYVLGFHDEQGRDHDGTLVVSKTEGRVIYDIMLAHHARIGKLGPMEVVGQVPNRTSSTA
ncbi:hypothetical protein [Brachybacterium timonense]|uniref:hypothetical protein n=1 Tax=Brachybacterium timonense TaxID=2050896 RepID=UPI000D0B7346|nr:hypothetical protein [Brachybacterium timonense]